MKKRLWMAGILAAALTLAGCGKNTVPKGTAAETGTEENAEAEADTDAGEDTQAAASYDPILYEDLTSQLVSLGQYKGVTVAKTVEEVTDQDVERQFQQKKDECGTLTEVDRAAQEWDVVVIDFTGYVDGETSDNLQGTEQSIQLGMGMFLEDFETQLVGASADEDVKVSFTFPEDYNEEVGGKDVEFDVHVHSVSEYQVEGWGDDYIKENLGYDSEEDMRASIRQELESDAQETAEDNWKYELVAAVLDDCEFAIEDSDVELYLNEYVSEYETYAQSSGMELDAFLQSYFGMTEDAFREYFRSSSQLRVQETLLFHAIAEKESLTVTEDEYQEQLQSLADTYGYEDTADVEAVYPRAALEEQMIYYKALQLIVDNAVEP